MKAVFLLSGGLDSQVLLACYRSKYDSAHCIGFSYGQRHQRELQHARQIAKFYNATFQVMKLPRLRGSALTGDGKIPAGLHFEDSRQRITVVPNRNAVMLSTAASVADANGARVVLYAPHRGDAAVYPDCRPEFVAAMDQALQLGCGVSVIAPFLELTKRDVVRLGRDLNVPLEMSWSCYVGGGKPCGKCGACIERTEALA